MSETWEQTKERLKKQGINLKSDVVLIEPIKHKPDEPIEIREADKPKGKLYHIYKRSLPPGIDKHVIFNVNKEEANWLMKHVLKAKVYHNEPDDTKTVIFYEPLPVDATPKERNIFYNPGPLTKENPDEETAEIARPWDDPSWIG